MGGSISSFIASSYFDFFMDPNKVLVFDMLLLVMLALAYFYCSWAMILLFLLVPPLLRETKHWALWKKYWSGSYGANSTWKLMLLFGSIVAVSGLILNGFFTHWPVVLLRTLRRAQFTLIENGWLFSMVNDLDSLILPDSAKAKSMKS